MTLRICSFPLYVFGLNLLDCFRESSGEELYPDRKIWIGGNG